jgi:hypothetical protein
MLAGVQSQLSARSIDPLTLALSIIERKKILSQLQVPPPDPNALAYFKERGVPPPPGYKKLIGEVFNDMPQEALVLKAISTRFTRTQKIR